MKKIFVKEIKDGDSVEGIFAVKQKNLAFTKHGNPYLSVILSDSSGEITGKIWEKVDELSKKFDTRNLVMIKGKATTYQERLQLSIFEIEKIDSSDIKIENFWPKTTKDIEEMFKSLEKIIRHIGDFYLRKLLNLIFVEDIKISFAFKNSPGAKSLHHSFIGGLLEHTITTAKLILNVLEHYDGINSDLLIAGALLHDIGKIKELNLENSFEYTDEGKLIGHIVLGVEIIDEKAHLIPNFPKDLLMQLKHIILSHHGELENGSPVVPKTLEAVIIHIVENLDSKINGIKSFISSERGDNPGWTSTHRIYNSQFYQSNYKSSDSWEVSRKNGNGNGNNFSSINQRLNEKLIINNSSRQNSNLYEMDLFGKAK